MKHSHSDPEFLATRDELDEAAQTYHRIPKTDYAKLKRHADATMGKWRQRGTLPPPYRCGVCRAFVEGSTLEEFEEALYAHLLEHPPA